MTTVPSRPSPARFRAMARQMASPGESDVPEPGDVFAGWRSGSIRKAVRGLAYRDALLLDTLIEGFEKMAAAEEAVGRMG